jgi:hypothetical protein
MQGVVYFGGKSFCFNFDADITSLGDLIYAKTGVSQSEQRVVLNGREIFSQSDLIELLDENGTNFVQLKLRLVGGKGGFGAMLRTSKSTKKTTNFSACRDLNGRRLGDIELEQRLRQREQQQQDPNYKNEKEEDPEKEAKKAQRTLAEEKKKVKSEREQVEVRKEILENLASSMDQGFAVAMQKRKESKEKKRKRKEVELPDELFGDFGLTKDEDEDNNKKKKKKTNDSEVTVVNSKVDAVDTARSL